MTVGARSATSSLEAKSAVNPTRLNIIINQLRHKNLIRNDGRGGFANILTRSQKCSKPAPTQYPEHIILVHW